MGKQPRWFHGMEYEKHWHYCSKCGCRRPIKELEDAPNETAPPDYYTQLGVKKEATTEEILKAYKAKAFEVHPDRNGTSAEAHEKFIKLAAARDILTDTESRKEYDAGVQVQALKSLLARCRDQEWCKKQQVAKLEADLSDDGVLSNFNTEQEQ